MMNFSFMLTHVLKVTALKKIEKMIVWSSSNALLNNFCNKENDNITCKKLSKKRKLQTFN